MKLVCPHCAKVIDVPESAAGQTVNCSLCQGPLTVPFGPSASIPPASVPDAGPPKQPSPLPPPPPPPPAPDPLAKTPAWAPPGGTVVPPVVFPPPTSTGSGGRGGNFFGKLQTLILPESVYQWVGLGALTVLFILFFFPWLGIYMGDTRLVEQSGLGVAFGSYSATPEGEYVAKNLGGSGLLLLPFFASLVGLLLLVFVVLDRLQLPPLENFKTTIQKVVSLREPIVLGCLVISTLVFLLYFLALSFPLETAAWTEKVSDTMLTGLQLKTEGITRVKSADMVPLQWLQRRGWFTVSLLIALISTLWIGHHWLESRGFTRNWPKIVLQWPSASPQLTAETQTRVSDFTMPRSN